MYNAYTWICINDTKVGQLLGWVGVGNLYNERLIMTQKIKIWKLKGLKLIQI